MLRRVGSLAFAKRNITALSVAATAGNGRAYESSTSSPFTRYAAISVSIGIALSIEISKLSSDKSTAQCEGNSARHLTRNFVADVVSEVSPAVVNIRSTVDSFYGTASSAGSGFIISKDGFIVTNAHVVEKAVDGRVLVTMKNSTKRIGRVHSYDTLSDIALIKLEDSVADLPVVTLGSSSKMRAGEFVVSIGSPMLLQDSASFGIVSAVARHATELGLTNNRSEYIQTDAAINVGNSGGPLVNMDGQVIGINTMTVRQGEGLSFAIPIDVAAQIIQQLRQSGRVTRPYIGLKMANMVEDSSGRGRGKGRKAENIFDTQEPKVVVLEVVKGSPAQLAGLRRYVNVCCGGV